MKIKWSTCNEVQLYDDHVVMPCVCGLQFKAAIANVWTLRNQQVTKVSLFSTQVIPDIMSRHKAADAEDLAEESPNVEPLLYIGEFQMLCNVCCCCIVILVVLAC